MGKRFLSAILAAILLLTLAGCTAREDTPEGNTTANPGITTQTPTEAPTGAATDPVPPTEATEQQGWTMDVHCGIREDGTFNEGTLFIGDSLTYGLVAEYLMRYELIGGAKYMAVVGAPLARFFSSQTLGGEGSIYSPEFSGLSYTEAVSLMGGQATAVYLMLGTNYDYNATSDKYIEVVDYILEQCPNATVHLQLVPYSSSNVVDYEAINGHIRGAYEHYQSQGNEKVMLIDTFTFIGMAQVFDGVHLNSEGKDAWYLALMAHKNNLDIPE